MRENKPFTVIAIPKHETPVQHYHCVIHGSRMVRTYDGAIRCPVCGGVEIAIKTVIANE